MWMTKKSKHIFTNFRVRLLKLLLQNTVHRITLCGFKQTQIPWIFCEKWKTKSWCQFWQAIPTLCQDAARLGWTTMWQQGRLGQGPPPAVLSHFAVKRWAETGLGWWPWLATALELLCTAVGMGWLQGQARSQVGEMSVEAAELRLTWLLWGPGIPSTLFMAWGWGLCTHAAVRALSLVWVSSCWQPGIHTMNTAVALCYGQALAQGYCISSWHIMGSQRAFPV